MLMITIAIFFIFFFFNDTATTEIYTLSLHDALPILRRALLLLAAALLLSGCGAGGLVTKGDRKSTRLNSSHSQISYAVFCLKKKKKQPGYSDLRSFQGNSTPGAHHSAPHLLLWIGRV